MVLRRHPEETSSVRIGVVLQGGGGGVLRVVEAVRGVSRPGRSWMTRGTRRGRRVSSPTWRGAASPASIFHTCGTKKNPGKSRWQSLSRSW